VNLECIKYTMYELLSNQQIQTYLSIIQQRLANVKKKSNRISAANKSEIKCRINLTCNQSMLIY